MDIKSFKQYVDDWMLKDIRLALSPAIKDGMNFASVILIFVGMDFMGSFLTGKDRPTKNNIIKYLEKMSDVCDDDRYKKMRLILYNGFRNGLIHNYFTGKPKFVILVNKFCNNGISYPNPDIHLKHEKHLAEGSIHVNIDAYCLFNDFKKTIDFIIKQIESQSNGGEYFDNYKKRWQQLSEQAKGEFEKDVLQEINNLN